MTLEKYGAVTGEAEREVGFYLADNFSMLPFVSAVEPLRIANRVARKSLDRWSIVTADGGTVTATNGIGFEADFSIDTAPGFSMLFISGPHEPELFDHKPSIDWLTTQGKRDGLIGGIETGCHVMARAGLLDGVRCTTHWENIRDFLEAYPGHKVSTDLYEVDGNRVTCSGGAASMDMMLYIIEQQHGHELATSVADVMIHPHIRRSGEPQKMDVQTRTGVSHPAMVECIELMESNIEQPLSPNELSRLVGISKRQLERLFRRYFNTTPARYYLMLRLEAARELLEQSSIKIIDVAVACGFKSAGHFSSRYYSSFGITPRETRKTT